jgi:hypothetical protein
VQIEYIHSKSLGGLYAAFSQQLHSDRRQLLPQTPQTIVVGNLDTETYLQRRLIQDDGVVMGVDFPFLESAIENFSLRCRHALPPSANESWFTAPPAVQRPDRNLALFDLEIVLLGILQDPAHNTLLNALGYDRLQLTQARILALAQKLAGEWYDYLLHIPEALNALKAKSPAAVLWKTLKDTLLAAGYTSALLGEQVSNQAPPAASSAQAGLILFGMPILSAHHLRALCGIARSVQVTIYATDFAELQASTDSFFQTIGKKFSGYRDTLMRAAKAAGVSVTLRHTGDNDNLPARVEIAALPGLWRAAEIIGDICHERLTGSDLRQTDISMAIHNVDEQFTAFERAFAMRRLTATCRSANATAPDANVELLKILVAAAESGIDREILLRYWQNPITMQALRVSDEDILNFKLALERAQGFRSDHKSAFEAYSLTSARSRFARAVFFQDRLGSQKALRLFDSAEQTELLLKSIGLLEESANSLKRETGARLLQQMRESLRSPLFGTSDEKQQILQLLERIEAIPGSQFLTLGQVVAIVENQIQGRDLRFNQQTDGIAFAQPGATAYGRRIQVLFDLNDKITSRDDDRLYMLPEFRNAPTRLSSDELLAIAMLQAVYGGSEHVILAYSNVDARTGAEFYPAHVLAQFERALQTENIEISYLKDFAATMIDGRAQRTPISADDDVITINYLNSLGQKSKHTLTDLLLQDEPAIDSDSPLTLRELHAFLMNPALHILSQRVTLPEEPAEFRFSEPALAVGKSKQASFCEDYLKDALRTGKVSLSPEEFVGRRQKSGELPAGGFDQAMRLLARSDNARRLAAFTADTIAKYCRIDITFKREIEKPFVKKDSDQVERFYIPAIDIGGVKITGECHGLYHDTATGLLTRMASATSKRRLSPILELHLLRCMLDSAKTVLPETLSLGYSEIAIASKTKEPETLDFQVKDICKIALPEFDSNAYLQDVVAALATREVFWFDVASLGTSVFATLATVEEKKLIDWHENDSEFARRPARSVFLKRFFDLSADRRSFEFYKRFIRPLAAVNAAVNAAKPKASKGSKK